MMKAIVGLSVVAALGACSTDTRISRDVQEHCERLLVSSLSGSPTDVLGLTTRLHFAGAACLVELARDVTARRVKVVAVLVPPTLAGKLLTADPEVAAQVDAELVSEGTAAVLSDTEAIVIVD